MKKKVCILGCLLISSTFGGGLAQKSIANPGVASSKTQLADILPVAADLSNVVLTLRDLPPGFTEASSLGSLKNLFQNSDFKPASVFAYQKVDDKQFQLLIGFTIQLSDPMQQAKFDKGIREGSAAKELSKNLNSNSKSLKSNKEWQLTNPTALTLQDNTGELSSGWRSQGKLENIPINLDMVMLRRGKIGFFMSILYYDGTKPTITISDAARKLDSGMMQLKPDLTKPQ